MRDVLDAAFSLLENSVLQRQQVWRQEYQSLQHQLEQCQAREARLREHNAVLVGKLNSLDSSPDRNQLLHKIKIISSHIDALAKDAAAFRQSCQHSSAR
ncbi:hypothetical protein D8L93_03640 [Sodalis-like symbiont of Bactericera trigonica]|nr:hypothetical protein D8L93_03640 [Sodalis-like symbiont of Bactericera trigonica]